MFICVSYLEFIVLRKVNIVGDVGESTGVHLTYLEHKALQKAY